MYGKIINNLSLEKSWEKNRMMYGKNREMEKNCETKCSNREPDEWWFPTLTTTPQNLMNDDFPPLPPHHRLILVFFMGFEPMITGTYRPHRNHYTTCPVLVLTCLIFFCIIKPLAYENLSKTSKNMRRMRFEPFILSIYKPRPNHCTTHLVLVLTCLIFNLSCMK
jgi:hypothetical protein